MVMWLGVMMVVMLLMLKVVVMLVQFLFSLVW